MGEVLRAYPILPIPILERANYHWILPSLRTNVHFDLVSYDLTILS